MHKFTSNSILYQAPVLILTFALGLLGTKLAMWGSILFNHSVDPTGTSLNFKQGYDYLVNIEGVWKVFAIGGFIAFWIILAVIVVLTCIARNHEVENKKSRDETMNKTMNSFTSSLTELTKAISDLPNNICDEMEWRNVKGTNTKTPTENS